MEQSPAKATTDVFRRIGFFSDEFPFSIHREIDRSADFNESKRFRREFWKIVCIVGGQGESIVNDERHPLRPGTIFLVHPDDATTFRIDGDALELYNILFLPELLGDGLRELRDDFDFFSIMRRDSRTGENGPGSFYVAESDGEIRRLVRSLEREFDDMPPNYRPRIRLLLLELLILLARKASAQIRRRGPEALCEYVDHLIERYFREEFKLETVAKKLGMDKSRLCRLYRAGSGKTVMKTLRRRRLREAAELLARSGRTVSEICFQSGFHDLSYFYRTFASEFGCNPGDYKKAAETGTAAATVPLLAPDSPANRDATENKG